MRRAIDVIDDVIFGHRKVVITLFVAVTIVMMFWARGLHIDAGFSKLLPLEHEYMRTFVKHEEAFGGANRVLIALEAPKGDIYTPEFFEVLRDVTDATFFVPGVDRSRVSSLFTPNVRFTEVVEDGISGGNVVPADFQPTPEGLEQVRENVLKAGIVGRLVANDFSTAIVSAQLMEIDPSSGKKLDYIDVSHRLEESIRVPFDGKHGVKIHIIGFAKVIGDVADGAARVVLFFVVALLVTALLVYIYCQSFKVMLMPIACSLMAVVWELGLLTKLGYGIDPMGILVPFLVFAIGVSHGIQIVSATTAEVIGGLDSLQACRACCQKLLGPGSIALASDTIGFITILLIKIEVIQEMAITASLGVGSIILTNLILLPVLLSFHQIDEPYKRRLERRVVHLSRLWDRLARVAERRVALPILLIAAGLFVFGAVKGSQVRIGDLHRGVPELRPASRYNQDSELISKKFSIGVDVLSVIVEAFPDACIDYDAMTLIDRYQWHMMNVRGVQGAVSLPAVAKIINAGWNEGSLAWRVLSRVPQNLVESVRYIPTSSGLQNDDCSVMPVILFTADHRAETIERIVAATKDFRSRNQTEKVTLHLATGNVGVMAATNEEVAAAQFPILVGVFVAVIVLCLLNFRSIVAVVCIVVPLGLVSLLAYALMATFEIGLKVNTLPVAALGVGIGVDYGIYIFARMQGILATGKGVRESFRETLAVTGAGVVFTGVTLAIGVGTWIFSPLQFQADMGILLTFMFLVNMLGSILLLPAMAAWLIRSRP